MFKAIKNVVSSVYLGFCYEDENETPKEAAAESRDSSRLQKPVAQFIHTGTDSRDLGPSHEDMYEELYEFMYEDVHEDTYEEMYGYTDDDIYDDICDDICDDLYEDRYVDIKQFRCDRCAGYRTPLPSERHNHESKCQQLPAAYPNLPQLSLLSLSAESSNPTCQSPELRGRRPNNLTETGNNRNVLHHKVKPGVAQDSYQTLSKKSNQFSGDSEFSSGFSSKCSSKSVIIPEQTSSSFVNTKTRSVSTTNLKKTSISQNSSKTALSSHVGSKTSSSSKVSSKTESTSQIIGRTTSSTGVILKTLSSSKVNSKSASTSQVSCITSSSTGVILKTSSSSRVNSNTKSSSEASCWEASNPSASFKAARPDESLKPSFTTSTSDRKISAQFQDVEQHMWQYLLDTGSDTSCDKSSLRAPSFPFRNNVIVTWYKQPISRPPQAEPDCLPLRTRVDMINLNFIRSAKTLAVAHRKLRQKLLAEDEELFFHATHATAAMDILLNGINMNKCKGRRDFSNNYGFYTTTDYKRAVKWGLRKSRNIEGRCGAIVAFRVNKQLRLERHLDLEVTTKKGKKLWKKVILYFRLGQLSEEVETSLRGVKYIQGPVLVNANLRTGVVPKVGPRPFPQVCICDEQFAKKFGSLANIFFVIFFNNVSDEEEFEDIS